MFFLNNIQYTYYSINILRYQTFRSNPIKRQYSINAVLYITVYIPGGLLTVDYRDGFVPFLDCRSSSHRAASQQANSNPTKILHYGDRTWVPRAPVPRTLNQTPISKPNKRKRATSHCLWSQKEKTCGRMSLWIRLLTIDGVQKQSVVAICCCQFHRNRILYNNSSFLQQL